MENTPEKKLLKFTKKLLDEFKEYLPLAVIYKLNVICCQSQNMHNREILNFLKNDIKIPSNYADTDTASCDEILAKYQKEDQHKLLRLKRCDSIPKLLQEIGYANFINAVIKKYPSPSIVGFPRKNWTAQCVLKYIRLYFNIPKSKKDRLEYMKLPALKTIRNTDAFKSRVKKKYLLKDILRYHIENPNSVDFYYLFMLKKHYKVSSEDKLHTHKGSRYNTTFIATIFNVSSMSRSTNRILSTSYNSKIDYINLNAFFEELSKNAIEHRKKLNGKSNSKIVIFLNIKNISKDEIRHYSSSLSQIPKYSLITFSKTAFLIKELKNLENQYSPSDIKHLKEYEKVNELKNNIEKLCSTEIPKLRLKQRIDKSEYITALDEILRSLESEANQELDELEKENIDELYIDI